MAGNSSQSQANASNAFADRIARVISNRNGLGRQPLNSLSGLPNNRPQRTPMAAPSTGTTFTKVDGPPQTPQAPSSSGAPLTTTMAPPPVPTAMPSPSQTGTYTGEVGKRLNDFLASDSPVMTRAANTGMEIANRRGLGNSSIAAGAAQNAVIDAAVPIVSQEAQMANDVRITGMNNSSAEAIADKRITADKALAELQANTQLTVAEKQIKANEILANLQKETDLLLADKRITADASLAEQDRLLREGLASNQIQSTEKLTAQELASREQLTARELASRETVAEAERKALADRQTQEIAAQQADTAAKLAAAERDRVAQELSALSAQRFDATANTLLNDKIPAGSRVQVQSSINSQYDQTVNYLQNLYNVTLSPSAPAPKRPASGTHLTLSSGLGG